MRGAESRLPGRDRAAGQKKKRKADYRESSIMLNHGTML